MANSFNISVKPEIAAVKSVVDANSVILVDVHDTDLPGAVTKIDANKTVIDQNKVILVDIHDTDLPNAVDGISANNIILADLHDTDIPALLDAIGANNVILVDLHDTDLPELLTAIDSNSTKLDTIDGISDAIKLKTDLLPQDFRGSFTNSYLTTSDTSFLDVCNVTGHGKLHMLFIFMDDAGTTMELILTVDGSTFQTLTHTGDADSHPVIPLALGIGTANLSLQVIGETDVRNKLFNLEFSTSLRVQIRRSAGTVDNARCSVFYSLDSS